MSNYSSELKTSFHAFKTEMITCFKNEIKADRIHLYTLLFIFLTGAAIRVYLNFFRHMHIDEGVAIAAFSIQPLYKGLTNYFITGNHLFFTFLSHISFRIFGLEPWAVRLPALIAGILIIPASYLFVRNFYNKHAALLAAAFVASSYYLTRFSIEARGYSIVTLFFLLILVIAAYLKQNRNLFLWYMFAILSALGAYTVTIMLYPFGIVVMFLFLSSMFKNSDDSRNSFFKDLLIFTFLVFIITLFLYSPVILAGTGLETIIAAKNTLPKEWSEFVSDVQFWGLRTWNSWNTGMPILISSFLVVGFFISIFFHKQLSKHRVSILLSTVAWIVPLLLIQRVFGKERIWLFLLPVYLGVASSGIYYLLSKLIKPRHENYKALMFGILSVIIVVSLGLNEIRMWKNAYYERHGTLKDPDYASVVIKKNYLPGDVLLYIFLCNDFNFEYHFMRNRVPSKVWNTDPKKAKRLLVYVHHEPYRKISLDPLSPPIDPNTLEDVLTTYNISKKDYSSPKILQRDKYAAIYILEKL